MTSVTSIMTDEILTLTADNTLSDARVLMTEHRIRHVPIVDEHNKLIGLISQRDVLAAEESSLFDIDKDSRLERESKVKINDFYRRDIVTISSKASVLKAALTIQKYKIGCLPIVDDDKLVGLVTDSDFVNVAINLLEVMAEQDFDD